MSRCPPCNNNFEQGDACPVWLAKTRDAQNQDLKQLDRELNFALALVVTVWAGFALFIKFVAA